MYIKLTNGKLVTKEQCVSQMREKLVDLGYTNMTYSEVEHQVNKILKNQHHDLSLIGELIVDFIEC